LLRLNEIELKIKAMKKIKTKAAYNAWAKTYDSVENKTRDLDAVALKTVLAETKGTTILEIGCGTGKNTEWLKNQCEKLVSVDFSKEMLTIAKEKIMDNKVVFKQADITKKWTFGKANLVTCNLILEHIENIDFVFQQASKSLKKKGQFFICEYHPFRQYQGKGARFEQDGKEHLLEYFVHHISDFTEVAKHNGFILNDLREWFDDNDTTQMPRLVSFLFQKK
jgi:ubiquinone/menaquinone biosynthesis C-methylase UbiE